MLADYLPLIGLFRLFTPCRNTKTAASCGFCYTGRKTTRKIII
ncbi:hypothetical protein O59_001690 [Cellvibrio sp. BR]|nr:hypothetical protein O59_001690 [Cellvibrio sp. BR]